MVKKHQEIKTLFLALFCVCFLTVAHVAGMSVLVYAALLLYLTIIVFSKDEYIIPLFLFFLPWSTVIKLSPGSISFCSIATILVLGIFCFLKGHSKFDVNLFFSVGGIFAVTVISSLLHDYGIATSHIMFIVMLIAYPLLIGWLRDKLDFETCTLYYSVGIISATVMALIFSGNENLLAYIRVLEDSRTEVVRHCGLYADPNFYAAQVVTAIGCQFVVISRKKVKTSWNAVLALALITCGITSISKSFLICSVLVLAVWLYCLTKQNSSKFLKVLFGGVLIVAVLLASGAFSDIIDQYLTRFSTATDASSLTTGRSDLWKEYIDFMLSNPVEFILGQGYTDVLTVRHGSHNTLIQGFYQLGIIGMAFLAFWLSSIIKAIRAKNIGFSYMLLLLVSCFSMWMGLDLLFFDDFFLTIALFAVGIKYVSANQTDIEKSKNQQFV